MVAVSPLEAKVVKQVEGSVFAIFERKEDAENFLQTEEASTYKNQTMVRSYREEYIQRKKVERDERSISKAKKKAIAAENQNAQVIARMTVGCLLELSGLPVLNKKSENEENEVDKADGENKEDDDKKNESLTVLDLKQWLLEKIGTDNQIAWVDIDPKLCKATVRFKQVNSAESAWKKLEESFGDQHVTYMNCHLEGRVLQGEEERDHWKVVLAAQQSRAQKRKTNRMNDKSQHHKRARY